MSARRVLLLFVLLSIGVRAEGEAAHDWRSDLRDPDPAIRFLATNHVEGEETVGPLRDLLQDSCPWVREAAARALGRIGPEARNAVQALGERLGDDDPRVRTAALRALARIGAASVEVLANALAGAEVEGRWVYMQALTDIGAASIPVLAPLLRSKDKEERRKALISLTTLGAPAAPALAGPMSDPDSDWRREAAGALWSVGWPDRPSLLAALHDSDSLVRDIAIQALAKQDPASIELREVFLEPDLSRPLAIRVSDALAEGRVSSVPFLLTCLGHQSPRVRSRSLQALRPIGRAAGDAVEPVISLLGDEELGEEAQGALSAIMPAAVETPASLFAAIARGGIEGDRALAVARACRLTGDAYFAALRVRVETGDPDAAIAAMETLADVDPLAAEVLTALWKRGGALDEDHGRRAVAVAGRLGAASLPFLMQALRDPDPAGRAAAADALSWNRAAGPEAVVPLIELLRDKRAQVRAAAATAFRRLGVPAKEAAPLLVAALKDSSPKVQEAAAGALARIGPDAVPCLVPVLTDVDEDPDLRVKAGDILSSMTTRTEASMDVFIDLLLDREKPVRDCAVRALPAFREAGIPVLERALGDTRPRVRQFAAWALRSIPAPDATAVPGIAAALEKALSDERAEVREEVVKSLGAIGEHSASAVVAALGKALSDERPEVREAAVLAIEAIDPQVASTVAAALGKAMHDPDRTVAIKAASILQKAGPAAEVALSDLEWALSDADLQWSAAWAIRALGPKAAHAGPALAAALDAPTFHERWLLIDAISRIGPAAKPAVHGLIAALDDSDDRKAPPSGPGGIDRREAERSAALMALRAIGPEAKEAAPKLIEMLKTSTSDPGGVLYQALRAQGDGILADLLAALDDPDPVFRAKIVSLLGDLGPAGEPALPVLAARLGDADPIVRCNAADAILSIAPGRQDAVKALVVAAGDEQAAVHRRAIWFLSESKVTSPDVLAVFVAGLGDTDRDARSRALCALMSRRETAASVEPTLRAMLHDETDRDRSLSLAQILWCMSKDRRSRVALFAVLVIAGKGHALLSDESSEDQWHTSPDILPVLIDALEFGDRYAAAWWISKIGADGVAAVPALIKGLASSNGEEHKEMVRALAAIGPGASEALPTLREMLKEQDPETRQQAQIAIDAIERK